MTKHFAISPDVNVRNIADWFILNTRIQRWTGETFHATAFDDFADLHAAFDRGEADIVLANAADTAHLIRNADYQTIAAPKGVANEAVIVVSADSPVNAVAEVTGPLGVAATDAPDVERICRILLEPADIGPADINLTVKRNPVMVAKAVMTGEAALGFLSSKAFDEMSGIVKEQIRPLVTSRISVVRHSLLASPALADQVEAIWAGLEQMNGEPEGQELSAALGAPEGWERLTMSQAELIIDLMEALEQ